MNKSNSKTFEFVEYSKYKVQSWNSRCHRKTGFTASNSIWYNHIIIHMVQPIGSSCIISQWSCCSTFKYLANACYSSCSMIQKPSTSPSSTCIESAKGVISCMLYVRLFHVCYMCSNSISTCSQQQTSLPQQCPLLLIKSFMDYKKREFTSCLVDV